jgi:predicted SAM-dependent methyltransferase
MKKLNLGCGQCYNPEWVNVDFIKTGDNVIVHNLKEGIPFMNNEFDVVYHSHLLEHFTTTDAKFFLKECFRVLKSDGILRIAVPDLEQIVMNYMKSLHGALSGDPESAENYEWIMLEMYDQTVRNTSGGEMAKYLCRKEIPNKEYVFNRIGEEGKRLRQNYLISFDRETDNQQRSIPSSVKIMSKRVYEIFKSVLMQILFRKEHKILKKESQALKIGRFRVSGEVHQWMYDRYSLRKLLNDCGFKNIRIVTAFDSKIKDWEKYQLDSIEGIVRKPDSLFIEAMK